MKQYLQTQKGSVMVLSLLIVVFLTIILSGLMPFVNSQVLHSSINNDTLEAQYAAEAGAKRAIVGLRNNRTDWIWTIEKRHNTFVDGTQKYYTTSISPLMSDKASPIADTNYTIISDGYVGNAHKRVVVTVRTASTTSGPFSYAAFSQGNMVINDPKLYGDIYSNGYITINSSTKDTVTGAAYCQENNYKIYTPSAVGNGFKVPATKEVLDLTQLMETMPNIKESGTNLRDVTNDHSGNFTLSEKSYYYQTDYGMYNQSYTITNENSVTIYVNGNFDIGKNITGGNITIYATGNITFNGGSVQASPGGTVNIYTNKVLTLNSGSFITGSTVTVLANNSSNSHNAIAFNGGSINNTLSGSLSKVSAKGNVALNDASVIAGQGLGMLVATGEVSLNGGDAPQTLIIAGVNVNGNSGSKVSGIYSNGTINMNGATTTYSKTVVQSLGLASSPFTIGPWSNQ